MFSKALAYSNDQDCFCLNHCGPILLIYVIAIGLGLVSLLITFLTGFAYTSPIAYVGSCFFYALFALLRRNIRLKFNVGSPDSFLGDFFMMCCICTEPCSYCQLLRAMPVRFISSNFYKTKFNNLK